MIHKALCAKTVASPKIFPVQIRGKMRRKLLETKPFNLDLVKCFTLFCSCSCFGKEGKRVGHQTKNIHNSGSRNQIMCHKKRSRNSWRFSPHAMRRAHQIVCLWEETHGSNHMDGIEKENATLIGLVQSTLGQFQSLWITSTLKQMVRGTMNK